VRLAGPCKASPSWRRSCSCRNASRSVQKNFIGLNDEEFLLFVRRVLQQRPRSGNDQVWGLTGMPHKQPPPTAVTSITIIVAFPLSHTHQPQRNLPQQTICINTAANITTSILAIVQLFIRRI